MLSLGEVYPRVARGAFRLVENVEMKAQGKTKKKPEKRTAPRRAGASPACALCAKLTQWKPVVRKTLDGARRFADDLVSGKETRESLIDCGELLTADAFIRRMHERSGYVWVV